MSSGDVLRSCHAVILLREMRPRMLNAVKRRETPTVGTGQDPAQLWLTCSLSHCGCEPFLIAADSAQPVTAARALVLSVHSHLLCSRTRQRRCRVSLTVLHTLRSTTLPACQRHFRSLRSQPPPRSSLFSHQTAPLPCVSHASSTNSMSSAEKRTASPPDNPVKREDPSAAFQLWLSKQQQTADDAMALDVHSSPSIASDHRMRPRSPSLMFPSSAPLCRPSAPIRSRGRTTKSCCCCE